ncbi:MAG TPA: SGNH/GDSL hydrolase family protein [Candidatus Krumholzibacteria bacterium]|nr:SGNH/GDSL hydrolase family protein [Candidatus Krumholzibacteria bacterium]
MARGRKGWLAIAMAVVTVAAMLVLGELLINIASPTEYLYPRYQFSSKYGFIPFANTVMVHGIPHKYQFHYTVNSQHSRGEVVTPGASGLPAVVVLGDSYTFGMGVNDGQEYPAVMRHQLAGRADVVNLGSPGWGLTQEIRRYEELGAQYHPSIVILQFCSNDPDDNLANRVTRVEDGEFKFADSANSLNFIKKYLSRSFVQRTQLYNFFRTRASQLVLDSMARRAASRVNKGQNAGAEAGGVTGVEQVYINLLDRFAEQLHAGGTSLWVISVDNQLDKYPHIEAEVHDLDARGELRYLEVMDWLKDVLNHHSPEGHVWGVPAHAVIGKHLADAVAAALTDSTTAPRS